MKPYETTLPAAHVKVLKAEAGLAHGKHHLRISCVLRELVQHFAFIADDVNELVVRLHHEIGFDMVDAQHIVANASHTNTALN